MWHRTRQSRILPPTALSKAVAVEMPLEARASAMDPGKKKIWIGSLAPEFERCINFETGGGVYACRPDEPFLILLLLDLLMAQPLSRRVPVLEKNLAEIATDLKKLSPSSPSTFCFEGRIGEECSCNSKAFTCYGAGCVGLARLASQRARFPR